MIAIKIVISMSQGLLRMICIVRVSPAKGRVRRRFKSSRMVSVVATMVRRWTEQCLFVQCVWIVSSLAMLVVVSVTVEVSSVGVVPV